MNNLKIVSAACLMATLYTSLASAQTPPVTVQPGQELCPPSSGIQVAYFNGVRTTKQVGRDALNQILIKYGTRTSSGEVIKYDLMYNSTAGLLGFEDFAETFRQRLLEQQNDLGTLNRWELFWEMVYGHAGSGSISSLISSVVPGYSAFISRMTDLYLTSIVSFLTNLISNPPTASTSADHQARIDSYVLEGKKLLFIAHSQGNLFLNPAYDYALPKTTAESLRALHIAPASPTTRGTHWLADKDLVINALRTIGPVKDVTNVIPGALVRPPGLNGETDPLGHGVLEIYLNEGMVIEPEITVAVKAAFAELKKPSVTRATSGFFTVTMSWDGSGDVDLHTFEPDNTHVYYQNRIGKVGTLDVDNVVANGPEHYFASCDIAKVKEGTYRVGINNFARATGRTATVQISSNKGGVLASKQLGVGPQLGSGGDASPIPVFNVLVKKGPPPPVTTPRTPQAYEVSVQ